MELTSDPDRPGPRWSLPKAAHEADRPALSPYLHYLCSTRTDPDRAAAEPPEAAIDSDKLALHLEEMLASLIEQSFR